MMFRTFWKEKLSAVLLPFAIAGCADRAADPAPPPVGVNLGPARIDLPPTLLGRGGPSAAEGTADRSELSDRAGVNELDDSDRDQAGSSDMIPTSPSSTELRL